MDSLQLIVGTFSNASLDSFLKIERYIYIYRGSTGWGADLQPSRLVQGKGSNPLKALIKENKVIYQKYKSAKFGLVSYCH